MLKKLRQKNWVKAGFTVIELLVVVGVMASIGAVGIGNVSKTKSNLKQKELDSYAQTLLISIQSKFAELRSSGNEEIYVEGAVKWLNDTAHSVPEDFVPSDFEIDGSSNFKISQMAYLVLPKASESDSNLIPESIEADLLQGSWVVEYNYYSGSVYGVFYSDSVDLSKDYSPKKFDNYRKNMNSRKGTGIGYAGGYYAEISVIGDSLIPKIAFEKIDGKLYVVFRCTVPDGFEDKIKYVYEINVPGRENPVVAKPGSQTEAIQKNNDKYVKYIELDLKENETVEVKLSAKGVNTKTTSETDNGSYKNITEKGNAVIFVENGEELIIYTSTAAIIDSEKADFIYTFTGVSKTGEVTEKAIKKEVTSSNAGIFYDEFVVDSLNNNQNFKGTFSKFMPGSDVTVYVTINGVPDKAKDANVTFNSLFASVNGNTAYISCGRHLQNLDIDTSSVSSTIAAAVLNNNINFGSGSEWATVYKNRAFSPIINANITSLDGNSKAINSINAKNTNNPAGLFETVSQTLEIKDLTLNKSTIEGTASGSLAGTVSGNLTISNCYVVDGVVKGSSNAGGIVGLNSKNLTIENTQVYINNVSNAFTAGTTNILNLKHGYVKSSDGHAGGLVGCVDGQGKTTIDNSSASIAVVASGHSGGLIGNISAASNSVVITKSYADSYVKGSVAGGLVGAKAGDSELKINNSYAAGYLYGSDNLAGMIANETNYEGSNVTIKNSYTVCKPITGVAKFYSIAKTISNAEKVYYEFEGIADSNANANVFAMTKTQIGSIATFMSALGGNFVEPTAKTTVVYGIDGISGRTKYDFPKISGLKHYGDWFVEESFIPIDEDAQGLHNGFVYWEKYSDGTYGLYYVYNMDDNTAHKNDYLYNNKVVVEDGYGVTIKKSAPKDIRLTNIQEDGGGQNSSTTYSILNTSGANTIVTESNPAGIGYLFKLSKEDTDSAPKSQFYSKLRFWNCEHDTSVTDVSKISMSNSKKVDMYINMRFAKGGNAMNNGNNGVDGLFKNFNNGNIADKLYVRSARQLYDLTLYYQNFEQKANKKGTQTQILQECDIDFGAYNWFNSSMKQCPVGSLESSLNTVSRYNHNSKKVTWYSGQSVEIQNTGSIGKTSYLVVFYPNNGSNVDEIELEYQYFESGVAQNLKKNAYKNGDYTFAGWSTVSGGSVVYKDEASFTYPENTSGDYKLYAVWTKEEEASNEETTTVTPHTLTLTFDANGGKGTMATQVIEYNSTQTLNVNAFTRVGYTFAGWSYTESDANKGTVEIKDKASILYNQDKYSEDTLYAVWKANKYTIQFNGDGGTFKIQGSEFSVTSSAVTYGATVNLDNHSFKKSSYKFRGWSLSYRGDIISALDLSLYSNNDEIKLYARWADNKGNLEQ